MDQELEQLYPGWNDQLLVESIYDAAHHNKWFYVEYMIERGIVNRALEYVDWYTTIRILKVLHRYDRDDLADGILKEHGYPDITLHKEPIIAYHMWRRNHKNKNSALHLMILRYESYICPLIGYLSSDMREYARQYVQKDERYHSKNIYFYLNEIEGKIILNDYNISMEPDIFSFDRRTYYDISRTRDPDIPLLHPKFSLSEAMSVAKQIRL